MYEIKGMLSNHLIILLHDLHLDLEFTTFPLIGKSVNTNVTKGSPQQT